ncbi:MAG: hypothetical protein KDA47_20465 [Planctomycetales bacterium]|nr:hypothetical protein [Planctomycetales bacterium]
MLKYLFRFALPDNGGVVELSVNLDPAILEHPKIGVFYEWSVVRNLDDVENTAMRKQLDGLLLPMIGGKDATAARSVTSALHVLAQQLFAVAQVVNIDYQASPFTMQPQNGRVLTSDLVGAIPRQLSLMNALLPQCQCNVDLIREYSPQQSDKANDTPVVKPDNVGKRKPTQNVGVFLDWHTNAVVTDNRNTSNDTPSTDEHPIAAALREVQVMLEYLADLKSRMLDMIPDKPQQTL